MKIRSASVLGTVFGTLSLAATLGCGGGGGSPGSTMTLPVVDCTNPPTFATVTIWPKCVVCHSTTLTGADRGGAPATVNFDDYTSAMANAMMAATDVQSGRMPKDGTAITEAEKQSLYAWALCGTPR